MKHGHRFIIKPQRMEIVSIEFISARFHSTEIVVLEAFVTRCWLLFSSLFELD